MKKNFKRLIFYVMMIVTAVVCMALTVGAEDEQIFTFYENSDDTLVAYQGGPSGKEVVIPDKFNGKAVVSVGTEAFFGNSEIEKLTFPESITQIGYRSFMCCDNLKEIIIPDVAVNIDFSAFSDTAYYKNKDNWENDVLYIGKHLIKAKNTISGSYKIKEGTLSIASGAFIGCTNLKTVIIPSSVKSIGDNAFYSCSKLSKINIPDSVIHVGSQLLTDSAYYNNESNWDNGLLYSGKHLLNGKENLSGTCKIKKDTLSVAGSAFYGCKELESITIPDSVAYIGDMAFGFNTKLKSVVIPDSVKTMGKNVFTGCSALKSVKLSKKIKGIPDYTFSRCTSLAKITIPSEVFHIGKEAFSGCSALKTVNMNSKLLNIGYNAFLDCESLESIVFPEKLKTIYDGAFERCTRLVNITIPDSVTFIGGSVFSECTNLESVEFPEKLKQIGVSMFYNCKCLKNVTLPASVEFMGCFVFYGCTSLEKVTIPEGTKNIPSDTFYNCSSLKSVVLPKSLKKIESGVFSGCSQLKDIYFTGSVSQWNDVEFSEIRNEPLEGANVNYNYRCAHNKLLDKKAKAATCSATGLTNGKKCADCGEITVAQKTVPAKGHTLTTLKAVSATCTKTGKTAGKKCSVCGKVTVAQKTVAKKAHTYKDVVTKATLTKNGKVTKKCSACGYTASKTTTVYSPKTIKLSTTTYTYNGKVKSPTVSVKDSKGKTLKKDTDYTVKYASGRKMPGKYTVTVTFKGKYSGTKKLTFKINPAAPKVTKATSTKKGTANLTWSNVSGESGYEVYFASSKNGTFKKLGTYKVNVTSASKSKLTSGKTYYFKVRAYKTSGEAKLYSSWSAVKAVKIK